MIKDYVDLAKVRGAVEVLLRVYEKQGGRMQLPVPVFDIARKGLWFDIVPKELSGGYTGVISAGDHTAILIDHRLPRPVQRWTAAFLIGRALLHRAPHDREFVARCRFPGVTLAVAPEYLEGFTVQDLDADLFAGRLLLPGKEVALKLRANAWEEREETPEAFFARVFEVPEAAAMLYLSTVYGPMRRAWGGR